MCKCPLCGIRVSYQHNLKAHLAGREPKGHGRTESDADDISRRVFDGTFRPAVKPISVSPIPPHDPALLANPYANFLIRLFETMVENKRLPKYQFERRVDAMITLFLPGILKQVYGWTVELVAPEFPLRKGTKKRSTNVDHLLFRHADGAGNQAAWIFFELKTDTASCNDPQLEIYRLAMATGHQQTGLGNVRQRRPRNLLGERNCRQPWHFCSVRKRSSFQKFSSNLLVAPMR